MILLRPNNNTYEGFAEKFSRFYEIESFKCLQGSSGGCNPFYFYGICIDQGFNTKQYQSRYKCLYNRHTPMVSCKSQMYNMTSDYMFNFCEISSMINEIYLLTNLYYACHPISLIITISTIFKLTRFREIKSEFHWLLIKNLLIIYTLVSSFCLIILFFNSTNFTYYACPFYYMLIIYADIFLYSTALAISIYLYGIVVYFDTQLPLLRRALLYSLFFGSFLLSIIVVVLDDIQESGYIISCTKYYFSSSVMVKKLIITSIIYSLILLIALNVHYKLGFNFEYEASPIFRVEYDILGNREEVSRNQILELLYFQGSKVYLLTIYIIVEVLVIVTFKMESFSNKFGITLYAIKDLSLMLYTFIVVWNNATLNQLIIALEKWYTFIDENVESKFQNSEFLKDVYNELHKAEEKEESYSSMLDSSDS